VVDSSIVEMQNDEAGFDKAVWLFVCTILDSETPRDMQYVYLAPSWDHRISKDLLTVPEMLRITELLPPAKTPLLSDKLVVQWYYMTYHKADRTKYVKSGKNCPTRRSSCSQRISSRFLLSAKTTARSNDTRSSGFGTAPSGCLRTTSARSVRGAAQIMHVSRRASTSADDTTGVDHTSKAATISATTINAVLPTVDRDATDAADTTTNQNVETATVEAIARRDVKATTVERRWKKGHGKKRW
jgi:hypothetical protein